jgi:hypothetical protein
MITPQTIADLRAKAEAATCGPWWTEPSYADNGEYSGLDIVSPVAVVHGEAAMNDDDTRFVAAANPQTIIALLDHIATLEQKVLDSAVSSKGLLDNEREVLEQAMRERCEPDMFVEIVIGAHGGALMRYASPDFGGQRKIGKYACYALPKGE